MGEVVAFILSALSGVVGNYAYNYLTEENIQYKVTSAYNDAIEVFSKKYPDGNGQCWEDILKRQENIDYIIKSLGYDGEEELNYNSFNIDTIDQNLKLEGKEYLDDFIKILKHKISKDFELGKLFEEKEHIIEQRKMKRNIIEMNNRLKESTELIARFVSGNEMNSEIDFNEIMQIYNEKDIDEQEFRLVTWLNNNNGHKEGVVLKAYIAYKQKKWNLAYKLYKFIVDKYSEEFELNNTIGLICMNMRQYEEAEKYYNLILSKDPRNLNSLFNLGTLYYEKYKDNVKALEFLIKAREVAPRDSEVLNNMGVLYKELKDYENARKCFELGMEYSEDNPLPFLNMAELNMYSYGKYDITVSCLERYLEFRNADKAEINNMLGLIYGSIVFKDNKKSIKHFSEALKLKPYLKEAKMNLDIIKSGIGYFDSLVTFSGDKYIDLFQQGYK